MNTVAGARSTHYRGFPCDAVFMDSGLGLEPVIGPAFGRTRWGRPAMTQPHSAAAFAAVARPESAAISASL